MQNTLSDSVGHRVKRNPRMCLVLQPTQLEGKMRHLTNRQLWLLQFERIAGWQKKMIQSECDRRQEAYIAKCRTLNAPIGWWF
jgi:hypothetical protein